MNIQRWEHHSYEEVDAFLELLLCPLCRSALTRERDDLVCTGDGHAWKIVDGIPKLVPPDLTPLQARTAEVFGWEWTHFAQQHPEFEGQFLDWIYPVGPEFFDGKDVLDAGCGTGRHAYFAARYGARQVVAMDLSEAVVTAHRVLQLFPNVAVVQGDLLRPPLRGPGDGGGFDVIYSIGVLHHLPDPREGFLTLARLLRPGGTLIVWVYGYENNGLVRNAIEPLRRVTTRLPPRLLRPISLPFSVFFHAVAKGVYRPLSRTAAGRALPLSQYLTSVADFSFRQNQAIVYDQLIAPKAVYIRGGELRAWYEEAGLEGIELSHRHGNSWRARGRRPG